MNLRVIRYLLTTLVVIILISACAPENAVPATATVDVIGTRAAELASMMLTQTVAAYSPTPPPTLTPAPTATEAVTPTPIEIKPPTIKNDLTPCYEAPSTESVLTSNISEGKVVELLAIGLKPGWYKIENPYFHSACWVEEANLEIDPNMDLSALPTE